MDSVPEINTYTYNQLNHVINKSIIISLAKILEYSFRLNGQKVIVMSKFEINMLLFFNMHNATNTSKIITYTACIFPSGESEEVLWQVGSIGYLVHMYFSKASS